MSMKEKGCHPDLEGGTKPPQKGFTAFEPFPGDDARHFNICGRYFRGQAGSMAKIFLAPLQGVSGSFMMATESLNNGAHFLFVLPDLLHIVQVVPFQPFLEGLAAGIIGRKDVIPENRFLISLFQILIPEVA